MEWVTQQARNLSIVVSERSRAVKFLLRDRDTKFTASVLPDPIDEPDPAQLRRNEILGGLVNEYRLAA